MKRLVFAASAFVLAMSFRVGSDNSPSLLVTHLRCEYLTNPLGIDIVQPRLSWVLDPGNRAMRGQRQTAYEIIVATSPEALESGRGDAWDSSKVVSDQTIGGVSAGQPLQSKRQYFWKARVWDEHDRPSNWSDAASWSMGLLKKS